MGGSFADKILGIDPPDMPKIAPPPPPPPMPSIGDAMARFAKGRRRQGRASTILTGELVPMDIGKRTLLG